VTRARERLYLCRAERDEGGRETTPSFFWRDAALALGLPADGPDAFGRAPADLDRVAPPLLEVATEHDLRRAVAASLRRREEGVAAVASDAPLAAWLARARRFRRIVADPLPPGTAAAFRAATRRLSPSSIQTAVDCPHRFFLAKVACVPDDDAPMGGLGADRRFFGEWIHRALELAVREPAATPEELAATVERSASHLPDDADRAFFVADLRRIVALFRAREAAAAVSGFVPRPGDVEIAFGEAGHEVRLGDGEGAFLLSGRVDRLDTSVGGPGPRRAIVVDYKTSTTATEAAAKRLRRAEELQLALYARALESVRGVSVVGLEHYAASAPVRAATAIEGAEAAFAARREGGKPAVHREPAEFREGTIGGAVRRASAVVARVRRGPDGGSAKDPLDRSRCAKCAYAAICRPDPGRFRLVAERADDRVTDDADDADDEGDS
jgi:ATP-dependent exoDNAse (exonuclease V) beta subunit